jgi:S1-C subfamily serine protease
MRFEPRLFAHALALVAALAGWSWTTPAVAQDLPRVSGTRRVSVAGIGSDAHVQDVLGIARFKFQGVIASELAAIGYRVVDERAASERQAAPPLTLVGTIKEEVCDEQAPRQCRVAIQWQLEDGKGVVSYRTLTRAVDQSASLDKQRRALVDGALVSLLGRRRFALQLTDKQAAPKPVVNEVLGFKRCERGPTALPQGNRSVAAALVFVESGSRLSAGAIVSPDGMILTGASGLDAQAPLLVRLSAEQKLPAELVKLDASADVALLRVAAHFDTTCLGLRETPLPSGAPVFGISSPPSEDRAISLMESVVQKTLEAGAVSTLETDARVAKLDGGPLLDDQGRVAAVVAARSTKDAKSPLARAVDVPSALRALGVKPAAITDPRLLDLQGQPTPAVGYVRDPDDPPFVLARRTTYGTSRTAHTLRKAGLWTAGAGALAVAVTWASFRSSNDLSTHEYNRLVVLNDLSWGVLGLGVVSFGLSYAWPEGHDVVAAQSARRVPLRIGLGPGGLSLSGQL